MKRLPVYLLLLLLVLPLAVPAEEEKPEVEIMIQIFRLTEYFSGDLSMEENYWIIDPKTEMKVREAMTLFTHADLVAGETTLSLSPDKWLIDDIYLTPKGQTSRIGDLPVLTSTSIIVEEERRTTIEVNSTQQIQYFEKEEGAEDLYTLRDFEESTGLQVSFEPESIEKDRIHLKDLTFTLRLIQEREPLEGVNLPVGKPILNEIDQSVELSLRANRSYGIILHPTRNQNVLLIRLYVHQPCGDCPDKGEDTP